MNTQEILAQLSSIFQRVFNDDELEVTLELTSNDIDEWSSVSQALMIAEIEQEFGVTFKLREVATMNKVATIVNLIESKLND